MANASNNGLLPIGGQQQNSQGYSQVSPMFGMYYNAAQAPGGNAVLGYNTGAMPYAAARGSNSAVPTAPTGGAMSAGQQALGSSNAGTSNSLSSGSTGAATSYGNTSNSGALPSAYSAANVAANKQTNASPVAAPSSAAAIPKYNPAGPLGAPQAMATMAANKSGQYQGASYHAPMAAPQQSPLQKWLAGDTTYQQQLAEFNQEKNAYNTNTANTKNQIDQNFNATQRSMNNQAALDRMNQQYDFAGRGVLRSGVYAQALDQYNTQFQNNMGNLVTGENQQLTANQTNLNNFLRQLTLQQDAAKQDAISRRAAALGITG